jgi:hypothetical protein
MTVLDLAHELLQRMAALLLRRKRRISVQPASRSVEPSRPPVTTQDFINFWGKIFVFILLVMIGISQGFKTF